ncbi:MAG: Stk1 family PASTA domain-containing Ser/Thr kinase [Thermoleophilia bacterium]
MSFAPGDLVGGRYELGRQLGAGGMARVYLGHDRVLDRRVAVKVLSEPYASDPQFVERFRREASAAAGLNHPNIVAVYDRGEADGSYYIVMEYLAGPDLKQVIRRRAPLPPLEAIDNAQQILAALGAAHRSDLIHRDVKPQNVLVAEDGHLKVTDFGIARAGEEADVTEPGSVIGTAQYLSPEQARGGEVTAASDCYAVGIVLYEMLTGRVPFDGGPPVSIAMKQVSDPPVPPGEIEPTIPPVLEDVVMRALAKRPSERWRTAQDFSRALDEARAEIDPATGTTRVLGAVGGAAAAGDTARTRVMDPVPPRVGPPPPEEPPPGRRRWPIIAGIVVLLLAAAAAAFVLLGGDEAKAVTIPPVAGQPAAEARATLEGLDLVVDERQVEDPDVEAGFVVDTEPGAGEEAREGDTVILNVSGGPGQETVPNVVGDERDAATRALRAEGFEVSVTTRADEDVESGIVISQDPAGNTPADVNSTVTIVVSTGPEDVEVPDVTGNSFDTARAELEARGLSVGDVTDQETSDASPGTVLSQDPGAGATVAPGTSVDLVVAAAVSQIQVPSGIIGNNATDARVKLEDAGFNVTSDTAPSDQQPAGVVIAVNPAEGTSVDRGSTVTITVSTGPSGAPPEEGGGDEGGDEGDEGGIETPGGGQTTVVPAPPPGSDERGIG